jgi:putative ABC transport system ATP-binding protein
MDGFKGGGMTMLQTKNLSRERLNAKKLSFADFSLEKGEEVLLLGPSGSGKTTFLSIISGLLKPTEGAVLLHQKDVYEMPESVRDWQRGGMYGFIFQNLHLLPTLTVQNNILLAAKMAHKPEDVARLEHLLGSLGIVDKAQRKPHELSQGERQRVAIARAVFNSPEIIIADEPTSALDDENAQITINLIREQSTQTGASLLLATHDSRIVKGFQKTIHLDKSMRETA